MSRVLSLVLVSDSFRNISILGGGRGGELSWREILVQSQTTGGPTQVIREGKAIISTLAASHIVHKLFKALSLSLYCSIPRPTLPGHPRRLGATPYYEVYRRFCLWGTSLRYS